MKTNKIAALTSLFILSASFSGHCGNVMDRHFSPEEQALWEHKLYIFTHLPDQPSGHQVVKITTPKGTGECLDFNFGAEDYRDARAAGAQCAARGMEPQAAVNELFSKAKERYPGLLYFVKSYVDAASQAYNSTPHP